MINYLKSLLFQQNTLKIKKHNLLVIISVWIDTYDSFKLNHNINKEVRNSIIKTKSTVMYSIDERFTHLSTYTDCIIVTGHDYQYMDLILLLQASIQGKYD